MLLLNLKTLVGICTAFASIISKTKISNLIQIPESDFEYEVLKIHNNDDSIDVHVTSWKLNNLNVFNSKLTLSYSPSGKLLLLSSKSLLTRTASSVQSISDVPQISQDLAVERVNEFAGFQLLQTTTTKGQSCYYTLPNDSLVLSWMIFDTAAPPSDKRIWIVDAMEGNILHSYSRVKNDAALVFPPGQNPSFGSIPPQTDIPSIINDGSSFNSVYGKDFKSANTCFAYKCVNRTDGTCDTTSSICVDPTPEMVEGKNYFTSTLYFSADGREIDYYYDWQANGYANNSVTMAWKNAPVATSRLSRPSNQIWGSDLAWSNYTGFEQTDANVELQAYFFLDRQATFLRSLLNNSSFCFLGSGPNCTVSDPSTNKSSGDPQNGSPIHFFANYQQLQPFPDQSSNFTDFVTQIFLQGKGKSEKDPVWFDQATSFADAFFSYMPFFPNSSRNCSNAGCLDQNAFPYTHFVFGQDLGSSMDWGLNECIVYHELTHALVHQFIPLLPSYVWADTGLRSDPGALNEAWADYFAAIHCGISDFKGQTYNRHPGRSLLNDMTCADSVGEIHTDGQIFSGALWEVRSKLTTSDLKTAFDRVVLRALTLGHSSDMFATQLNLVLDLLKSDTSLSFIYQSAYSIFARREFECERVQLVQEKSDTTFQLITQQLNYNRQRIYPSHTTDFQA